MAVQAFPYLILTDGATTITLANGSGGQTNYPIVQGQWAPAVPSVRTSFLGGLTPYAEVAEQITINVIGATAALAMDNLQTLARLIDQADRWWTRGENVNPVTIKYAPQGSIIASTAIPYIATVLGRAGGNDLSGASLPATFNNVGMYFEIRGVRLTFLRSGLWTVASEGNASSTSVANPVVQSTTMPASPTIVGPLTLSYVGFTTSAAGAVDIPNGFVMLAPQIDMQQAESPIASTLAAGATYVSTADAAARASGGNVGRLNHAAAAIGVESVISFAVAGPVNLSKQIAVYCTYRNNTATAWTIRASGGYGLLTAAAVTQTFAPTITIPGAATNPTALYLGTIANRYGVDYINLNVAMTALSGAATLDFDTIVFVDMSTGEAYVLALGGVRAALGGAVASQNVSMTVANTPGSLATPDVRAYLAGGNRVPITYSGDAALTAKGGTIKTIWYATHLWNGATPYWTTQNVTGAATLALQATIQRLLGYVVPN